MSLLTDGLAQLVHFRGVQPSTNRQHWTRTAVSKVSLVVVINIVVSSPKSPRIPGGRRGHKNCTTKLPPQNCTGRAHSREGPSTEWMGQAILSCRVQEGNGFLWRSKRKFAVCCRNCQILWDSGWALCVVNLRAYQKKLFVEEIKLFSD